MQTDPVTPGMGSNRLLELIQGERLAQKHHFLRVEFAPHAGPGDMERWHPALSAYGMVTKADDHTYCVEVIRDSKFRGIMVILAGLERFGTARWTEITEQQMRDVQAAHQAEPQREVDPAPGRGVPAAVASVPNIEERPERRRLTAPEKRALKAAELQRFVQQYGRGASPGFDPNDRSYDRELEQKIKRMPPEKLDRLLRDDED